MFPAGGRVCRRHSATFHGSRASFAISRNTKSQTQQEPVELHSGQLTWAAGHINRLAQHAYLTFRPSGGRRRGWRAHQTASQNPARGRADRCTPRTNARCPNGRRAPTSPGSPRSTKDHPPSANPASFSEHHRSREQNRAPRTCAKGLSVRKWRNYFLQQTTENFGRSTRAPRATSQPSSQTLRKKGDETR